MTHFDVCNNALSSDYLDIYHLALLISTPCSSYNLSSVTFVMTFLSFTAVLNGLLSPTSVAPLPFHWKKAPL